MFPFNGYADQMVIIDVRASVELSVPPLELILDFFSISLSMSTIKASEIIHNIGQESTCLNGDLIDSLHFVLISL